MRKPNVMSDFAMGRLGSPASPSEFPMMGYPMTTPYQVQLEQRCHPRRSSLSSIRSHAASKRLVFVVLMQHFSPDRISNAPLFPLYSNHHIMGGSPYTGQSMSQVQQANISNCTSIWRSGTLLIKMLNSNKFEELNSKFVSNWLVGAAPCLKSWSCCLSF